MPAFPGAHQTFSTDALRRKRQASACSRPPLPTTRIFIAPVTIMGACARVNGPRSPSPLGDPLASYGNWCFHLEAMQIFLPVGSCRDSAVAWGRGAVARSRSRARAAGPLRTELEGANRDLRFDDRIPMDIVRTHGVAVHRARMEFGEPGYRAGGSSVCRSAWASRWLRLWRSIQLVAFRQHAPGFLRSSAGGSPEIASKLMPQNLTEALPFVALVCTVSLCEEFLYRGFVFSAFQRVLAAPRLAAILGSSVLFGVGHVIPGAPRDDQYVRSGRNFCWRAILDRQFGAADSGASGGGPGCWTRGLALGGLAKPGGRSQRRLGRKLAN